MNVSVAEQQRDAFNKFDVVERLERIAAAVGELDKPHARELDQLAEDVVDSIRPVRIAIAASLLSLSTPTIRAWSERGLLTPAADSTTPAQTLDPHRLHQVLHVVRALRELGEKPGNLADQVWHRLQDRALLDRDDLREGLDAWRSGDVVDA